MKFLLFIILIIPSLCFGDMNPYIAGITSSTGGQSYSLYWDIETTSVNTPNVTATLNAATIVSGGISGNMLSADNVYQGYASIPITTTELDVTGDVSVIIYVRRTSANDSTIFTLSGQAGDYKAVALSAGTLNWKVGDSYMYFDSTHGGFDLALNVWYKIQFYVDSALGVQGIKVLNADCSGVVATSNTCVDTEETIATMPTGSATTFFLGENAGTQYLNWDDLYVYKSVE